jgi:hypothetical protein
MVLRSSNKRKVKILSDYGAVHHAAEEQGEDSSEPCIQQSNLRLLYSAASLSLSKLDVEQEVQEIITDGRFLGFGDMHNLKIFAADIQGQLIRENETG